MDSFGVVLLAQRGKFGPHGCKETSVGKTERNPIQDLPEASFPGNNLSEYGALLFGWWINNLVGDLYQSVLQLFGF
jgi:hypothetical protein